MEKQAQLVAALLKVLANEHRLLILCALEEHPMTVGELASRVGKIGLSALSQHLALLKAHGILSCEKQGLNVIYQIQDEHVGAILSVLKEHYCP